MTAPATKVRLQFFRTPQGELIQHHPVLNTYHVRNRVGSPKSYTPEEFASLGAQLVNRWRFAQQMNDFFRDVEHRWIFQGTEYRKLPNFPKGGARPLSQPLHPRPDGGPRDPYLMKVYHWGRVYLFLWSYSGEPTGCLYDVKTGHFVKWTKPQNCAPFITFLTHRLQ